MTKLYSALTRGFYDSIIHGDRIPEDAQNISVEKYEELLDAQRQGKLIVADVNGFPIAANPPEPSTTERRTSAKTAIDTAAGNARARFVSNGQLVEEEYRLTQQQTLGWRAAGSLTDSVPASIQAWADAEGITAEEAATSIEQIATAWESVLLGVRQLRLAGKASVDASADDADFNAVAQVYIDQLDAMKP